MDKAMYKIGFIGIGNMGWAMAANLSKKNFNLTVFDSSPEKAKNFASTYSAIAASTIHDLADCNVIITMLPTGQIVREALLGGNDDSLANDLSEGAIVIDMSSSEPFGTKSLGDELGVRGVILVDAPVSGGVLGAQSGRLTIMYGGDDSVGIEKAVPVLSALGTKLFNVGGLGCGHAMKAINNYVAATTFAATSEALDMGAEFGLDQATIVDILNVSTGRNFHTDIVIKDHVLSGSYDMGFAIGLLAKDVKIAADLSHRLQMNLPLLALMNERWELARSLQGSAKDYTEAHLAWNHATIDKN